VTKYSKSSFVDVTKSIKSLDRTKTEISQEIEDLTIEAAKFGAEKMKEYISTRGTGVLWASAWRGRKTGVYKTTSAPGRIDSGDMLNAVGTAIQAGPKESRAAFGWVRNFEEYFRHQEYGFNHWIGVRVEGMFALRDARRDVVAELPRLAKKYEKRIAKRISQ
jgi:hypothetical protein